jgi:hypothetical protein
MNVQWQFPDGTLREQQVTDMEQLLFVLRMVGGVTIGGITYKIAGSSLIVDQENVAVAVNLE